MTNLYVRSADGLSSDSGLTWALAKDTVANALAVEAAGDRIFSAAAHNETTLSGQSWAMAGTYAAPVWVMCVDDTGDPQPPTTVAETAVITTQGASAVNISGVGGVYGHIFNIGTGSNYAPMQLGTADGHFITLEKCKVRFVNSHASAGIVGGISSSGAECRVHMKDTWVRFGAATQRVSGNHCYFEWDGGGIESGGTAPTGLVALNADQVHMRCRSLDLSAGATNMVLVSASAAGAGTVTFENCKLPSGWTGSLFSASAANVRVSMFNCDAGNVNYRRWEADYFGETVQETTIVRSGGASDGTTPISWKMTGVNVIWPFMVHYSGTFAVWNDTVGSAITITVEIVHDSATDLNDDDIFLEVESLSTSGYPLGVMKRDCKASWIATAAAQDASSATWTTTGLSTPRKQKLVVTVTPQMKGYIQMRVGLAAVKTVYICPKADIT